MEAAGKHDPNQRQKPTADCSPISATRRGPRGMASGRAASHRNCMHTVYSQLTVKSEPQCRCACPATPSSAAEMEPVVTLMFIQCRNVRSLAAEHQRKNLRVAGDGTGIDESGRGPTAADEQASMSPKQRVASLAAAAGRAACARLLSSSGKVH